jgi:hypothetical protein
MIDDTGLDEFHGSSRSRLRVFTLAAISLAAACIDEVPPDDAIAAELSSSEVLALCDELRDAVQRNDEPIECDSGERYWILPSNESCRNADLSACDVTVGQLRRCHELVRGDPCAPSTNQTTSADLSPIDPETLFAECRSLEACAPFAPAIEYGFAPSCTAVGLEGIQAFDGVYEVTLARPMEIPQCPPTPAVLEAGAPRFVLVSTEASGVPESILQSCVTVADCQALARDIQAAASPRGPTPYNHLRGCSSPFGARPALLQFVPTDAPTCQTPWLPRVSVSGDPSLLAVSVIGAADTPEISPGCGYIIPSSLHAGEGCGGYADYEGELVSPL